MSQERRLMRKTVLLLAWPVIVQNLLMSAMNIADTIMLGWFSNTALASIGIAVPIIMSLRLVLMAIPIGALAMVARGVGECNSAKTSDYACTALWVGLVLGGVVSWLGYRFSPAFAGFFTSDPNIINTAVPYLQIVFLSFAFSHITMIATSILRGAGDTQTPMRIAVACNILNIFGNYALIYGKFGFSPLGVKGAAISTALCSVIECVLVLSNVLSRRSRVLINLRDFLHPDLNALKTLLRISLPAAIEPLILQSGMLLFTKMVASLGELSLAAFRILITIEHISFMPGLGFSIACSAIIGQSLGAGNIHNAKLGHKETMKLTLLIMGSLGIVFLVFPGALISLFTGDAEIIKISTWCLMIAAIDQPLMGYTFIHLGTLRGAGETKSQMLVAFLGMWVVRLPLTYLLAYTAGLGLLGVWLATPIDWLTRGFIFRILYLQGRWQKVKL